MENILCSRLLLHVYVVHDVHARRPPSTLESGSIELRVLPKRPLRGHKNEITVMIPELFEIGAVGVISFFCNLPMD